MKIRIIGTTTMLKQFDGCMMENDTMTYNIELHDPEHYSIYLIGISADHRETYLRRLCKYMIYPHSACIVLVTMCFNMCRPSQSIK